LTNTKENHIVRIVQPTTTDTGEHNERAFEYVYTLIRSKQNITKYIDMMAKLVQAVVTSKAFKKNRTKPPFSDWETVSIEAFLILCLGNYEKTRWCAKKLRVDNGPPPQSGHEVEELIPEPHYTGKVMGQSKAGQKRIKVFNGFMVRRVHLDRAKNGKKFNSNLFMQSMKDKFEKKKTAANNKHVVVEAAASHEDRDDFILSNFNSE
jgi:hypothetical protein